MSPRLLVLILGLLILILTIRIFYFYSNLQYYSPGQAITFRTHLSNQPKLSAKGQRVSVSMPNSQRATVVFKLDPLLSYGDVVYIHGKVNYFKTENGKSLAQINYPEFKLVKKGNESNLILKVRDNIIYFFNSNLPRNYSALMLGIVFGIKEEMSPSFYADLQKTGLMHVIAASGMNITLLGGFLSIFFLRFMRRQAALVFTIFGILFYAMLAGFEASIVRAAIMGIIVFTAQLTGRQSSTSLALFFAAFLMLMRSPSLILDVGFQLSFLATLGLIYLRPIFYLSSHLKKLVERSFIGEDVATTITAQIFTLPILFYNFGNYSPWSIVVNALVLWTVPILMIIGGISAVLGLLFEPVGRLILYLSIPFLLYFTKIVRFFGSFAGQIEIKTLPILLICGYYLILIAIILFIKERK
jgi:competence protein ComEC